MELKLCVHRLPTKRPWSEKRVGLCLSLKKLHWLTKKDESAEESEKKWLERSVRKEVTNYMAWGKDRIS